MIYRFDNYAIDTDRFELLRDDVAQKVEPQVFALLELLVSHAGKLVTKDDLNLRIWGGRIVSEAVVNSRIRSARQAIGDDGKAQRYIQTVHNRGYRFVGEPVQEDVIPARPAAPVTADPTVADTAEPGTAPSIAVLPFQLLSLEPRHEMLADAVAHEVIVELSRLHWLFVIARGSSFRFRGPDVDLKGAADILGVRYLLTGSLAIDGSRSVATVELTHAPDSRLLWAEKFEGPVDDLLGLRVAIATQIVSALELRIPMLEARRVATLPTENLDSWSAYHRGLWHMFRFNAHDNGIAAHMFQRAVDADPNFARAHAGLSFTHFQNAFVGYVQNRDAERQMARALAEKSMALDPLDPFANLTMGRTAMLERDFDTAVSWFDRCIELNPNYAFAHYNRALADAVICHGGKSEDGATKAMSLSPIDPMRYAMLSTRSLSHIVRGDYAEACPWAEQGAQAPNAHVHIQAIAALANELAGNREAASRWVAEVHRMDPSYRRDLLFRVFPFRDERTRAAADAALKRLGI